MALGEYEFKAQIIEWIADHFVLSEIEIEVFPLFLFNKCSAVFIREAILYLLLSLI